MSACATSSSSSSDPATINHVYYYEFQIPVRGTCSEDWWSFQDSCYLALKKGSSAGTAQTKKVSSWEHSCLFLTVRMSWTTSTK
ncbi:hypothetical protein J4Q44_G00163870 [Coregonus suidteri]|uniref:Uncharacterized protein n=1 Tax=Coregonus suidteri TaxID=861788 RepID=A0AAN8QQZ8_9TELE